MVPLFKRKLMLLGMGAKPHGGRFSGLPSAVPCISALLLVCFVDVGRQHLNDCDGHEGSSFYHICIHRAPSAINT